MAEVSQRQRRAEGRDKRRARSDKPVETTENAPRSENATQVGPQLQRALMTAAAAALAGGLAGAAKAVVDRRGRRTVPDEDELEHEDRSEAHDEPAEQDLDAVTDEQETAPADAEKQESRQEQEGDEEQEGDDEQESDEEQENDDNSETSGAPSGEVAEIIARARQEVEQILGCEAEGVSGIERSNGRWSVTVEVVELRRIPESTDVLASYAVVLDGDGDLVSLERTHRYRRSQVEEG
jgi:hypothetical protein